MASIVNVLSDLMFWSKMFVLLLQLMSGCLMPDARSHDTIFLVLQFHFPSYIYEDASTTKSAVCNDNRDKHFALETLVTFSYRKIKSLSIILSLIYSFRFAHTHTHIQRIMHKSRDNYRDLR